MSGVIDAVLVGADRIAANGDTINKIGTYSLALVAKAHDLPFLVAAPLSTVDFSLDSGIDLPVAQGEAIDICQVGETITCPAGVSAYNPLADATPAELITAIVTEHGAIAPADLTTLAQRQA